MGMLFKTKNERKISICDKDTHKARNIPVDIHQTNKRLYVIVQSKYACKLELADNLWLPVID